MLPAKSPRLDTRVVPKMAPVTIITVHVADQYGVKTGIKIKTSTQLKRLFKAIEKEKGIAIQNTYKYLFDGEKLDPELTVSDYDMEDGDEIDMVAEQVGGQEI